MLPPLLSNLLLFLGAIGSLRIIYKTLQFAQLYLRPSSLPRYLIKPQNNKGSGSWALVTGASDGIGLGFVEELLAQGFSVLVHSRNPTKLVNIQRNLQSQYPHLGVEIVAADATRPAAAVPDIISAVSDIEKRGGKLTVLVNNVGGGAMAGKTYDTFEESTPERLDSLIDFNARFMVQLTKALLPRFRESERPALILNMGSAVGIFNTGVPYLTIYAGGKAFALAFSSALSAEMRALGLDNIEVLGIIVGSAVSAGNNVSENYFAPTSRAMAAATLNRVGCGKTIVWGYGPHAVQGLIMEMLPQRMQAKVMSNIMNARREIERKGT